MTDRPGKATLPGQLQPDLTAQDPYRVLGVEQTASQADIKRAYFGLIRQYPPETEAETFKLIRAAYEKLKDAGRRSATDLLLPQPPYRWEASSPEPTLETAFNPNEVLLLLRRWGELGRTDFRADFREIEL